MQSVNASFFLLASIIFLVALGASGKSIGKDEDLPDPKFLSTDLYFQLSDIVVSLPAVALKRMYLPPENRNPLPDFHYSPAFGKPRWFETREYKDAVLAIASNPETPAKVSAIRLNFGYYGTYGEYGISSEICPKLTNDWSRKACSNQLRKELKQLPKNLYLSTVSGLEVFRHHSWAGAQSFSVGDLLDAMEPFSGTTKIACDKDQSFCRAAILVSDELLAVWSPKCTKGINGACKYDPEAEGTEILNFVLNELRVE